MAETPAPDALSPLERGIVDDEVGMAARVARRIARSLAEQSAAERTAPSAVRVRHDEELKLLRDQIAEARNEDVAALLAAMIHTAGVARIDTPKAAGNVDPETPYFGHMRLDESGRSRDVLIGKRGMIDREAGVVIVDWRDAPVSRLYYRYDEGDEYEEELGDKVREGKVLVRRTVSFVNGKLTRVRCPAGTFVRAGGDAWRALQARAIPELRGGLGKAERAPAPARPSPAARGRLGLGDAHLRPDKHLPEIAALIDAAQFDAMTQADSGLVILQGGAGSGKTTVALHRVAYLAYGDDDDGPGRGRAIRPAHTIVVVAQPQLARYVERLLPSLDVAGVRVFAYRDWARMAVERLFSTPAAAGGAGGGARRRRRKGARAGDGGGGSGRSRVLGRRLVEDPPPDVSRTKKHPGVLAAVREQWRRRFDAFARALEDAVRDRPGAAAILAAFAEPYGASAAAAAPGATTVRVRAFLDAVADLARGGAQRVPPDTLERVRRVTDPFLAAADDVVADWEELITDRDLLSLTGLDEQTLDATLRYTKRQVEEPPDDSDIDEERKAPIDAAGLDPDDPLQAFDEHDLPLLLAMWIERTGGLAAAAGTAELTYDHVVVDEAQDLAAIELAPLVVATGARRSVTLAGDVVQKVVFDAGYDDWPELEAQLSPYLLGRNALSVEPFRLSYRSTAEVVAFARAVLGPLAPKEAPRAVRNGAPIEAFSFADTGEEIAFLAESLRSLMAREPQASVALLCRYPERARFYANMLQKAEVPRLRCVLGRDDFTFSPGIDVGPVARMKGLEYDYVILAEVTEAMYPDQVAARHLLHIGATRAAHQLWITTSIASPSPLLPPALLVDSAL